MLFMTSKSPLLKKTQSIDGDFISVGGAELEIRPVSIIQCHIWITKAAVRQFMLLITLITHNARCRWGATNGIHARDRHLVTKSDFAFNTISVLVEVDCIN